METRARELERARCADPIRDCLLCDDRGYFGLRAGPFISCPHSAKKIDELERYYEQRGTA